MKKKLTLKTIKEHVNSMNYSFANAFYQIIKNELKGYSGNTKEKLVSFLAYMEGIGCKGGMIQKFIHNEDCKKFYTKHIEDLEKYTEIKERFGDFIKNSKGLPRYTFVVWLAFEEFCSDLDFNIFDKE